MRSSFSIALALALFTPVIAGAQGPRPEALAPKPEDVQAASAAFAEGQRAQLRGDYSRAAELFEIADQAASSPAALRSAIRNHEAASHDVRAATLALAALGRYPDDRETRAIADDVLARLGRRLTRVSVRCDEPCTLTIDGGLVGAGAATVNDFFIAPGHHALEAHWPGRPAATQALDAVAGQTLSAELHAPPPAAASPAPTAPATTLAPPPSAPPVLAPAAPSSNPERDSANAGRGLPPAVFWVGTGLTVVAGGLLLWSGLDTLSARDDYVKNPTQKGYDSGVKLETRTNVLLGTTAVLGLATAGVGLFATNWGSSRAALAIGPERVALSVSGTLP